MPARKRKPQGRVFPASPSEGLSAFYPDQVRPVRGGLDWKNRALRRIEAVGRRLRARTRAAMLARLERGLPVEDLVARQAAIEEKERRLAEPLKEAIREASTHNLRLFRQSVFNEYLARRLKKPGHHAVAFIDIDAFKQLNDALGHAAGDRVLVLFSRALRNAFGVTGPWPRREELASRYGGDEFALYLPLPPKKAAEKIRRVEALFKRYQRSDRRLPAALRKAPLSLSVGVACRFGPGWSAEKAVEEADQLMYEAKRRGKGRLVVGGRGDA